MKTALFTLAAISALFGLPVDLTIFCSVLFAAGLMAILVFDYRRGVAPKRVPAMASTPSSRRERLGLAA